MPDEELKVPDELFKDVKFYVVGDIDQKVVQLLKAGKAKEVSYNALATHIIAEDGDNPEVGESREVFDLPVVKPSWVILSVRCGDLLPVTGFSPESGQIFFGVTACLPKIPEDRNPLWALVTYYGGECQLNLNKKCTHLIVPEPKGEKYECALKQSSIQIVTPEWVLDSVSDKTRKDEVPYHPRLTYQEEEEEEVESDEEYDRGSQSDGSYIDNRSRKSSRASSLGDSPLSGRGFSPKPGKKEEIMFDDSSDSSPEKQERNLNWTPAELPQTATAKRRLPHGKDSGLINLCAIVPPVPGSVLPPEARNNLVASGQGTQGPERPELLGSWNPAARTLRNITNNADIQQVTRPSNVAHVSRKPFVKWRPVGDGHHGKRGEIAVTGDPVSRNDIPSCQVASCSQGVRMQFQKPNHEHGDCDLIHKQSGLVFALNPYVNQLTYIKLPLFSHLPNKETRGLQNREKWRNNRPARNSSHVQQITHCSVCCESNPKTPDKKKNETDMYQSPLFLFTNSPKKFTIYTSWHIKNGVLTMTPTSLEVALPECSDFHRRSRSLSAPTKSLEQQANQSQQGHANPLLLKQQAFPQAPQQAHQFLQQPHQQQIHQQLFIQNQTPQQLLPHTTQHLQPQQQQQVPLQPLQQNQLFGHDPGVDIPEESFLIGCVFGIADYPEQMSDKQLLATWKRIIQAHGGAVDSTLNPRCTHLLCESQVSSMYVQALREGKRCVTAHWLNTVLKKKKMVPPHRTLHFPFAFPPGGKPCSQHIVSVTGFIDTDRDDLKLMAYLTGAKYTGYLCRSNTVLICKEPSGLKYEKAKEWRIPCVNAQWLCDILLGNFEALRQIQHSRYSVFNLQDPLAPNQHLVQNLLAAWQGPLKISPDVLVTIRLQQKQRQSEPNPQPPAKKPRIEDLPTPTKKLPPESTPAVFFTGFEPAQVQQYIKKLYVLGGEVAECVQKCTHLIASKVTRTVKFLTAVSIVKHIVTPEWLEESWKTQKFVDEQNFVLRDAEAEVLFCFSLEESLKRAHSAPLFKGKYFYITPGICPSLTTMKSIVECAGGKVLAKQPSFRKIMEHKQNKSLPEIILISCENDLHLCREYFAKNIDVHNAEFILTGVLTQTLDYETYPL
uniref:PAX-interacting protein 1 n=1 Tax=Lepisosteus oculatus TaxID=7918 RepID=W5N465_LEPOC